MGLRIFTNFPTDYRRSVQPKKTAVSVTSNGNGFTSMHGHLFNYQIENERSLAEYVNETSDIYSIEKKGLAPLIIVPKTFDIKLGAFLTRRLASFCLERKIELLYFMHFVCLRGRFPAEMASTIIDEFQKFNFQVHNLDVFVDMNMKHKEKMDGLLKSI